MSLVLNSEQDSSVNFVTEAEQGYFESRFVQRSPDYFACYLSAQSGCNKGCRFCHLTQTKQTQMVNATELQILSQAIKVCDHYQVQVFVDKVLPPVKYVHLNFMARGEFLDNHLLTCRSDLVFHRLKDVFYPLPLKINISTIFPKAFEGTLTDTFRVVHPTIYYSYYSDNPAFRKRWLPQAQSWEAAFEQLKDYQRISKKPVKIHHALIAGQNDDLRETGRLIDHLQAYGLTAEVNFVHYNPAHDGLGSAAPEQDHIDLLTSAGIKAKKIERVGFDVYASCGMFYQ